MAFIELCGGVHIAQRQTLSQMFIRFCAYFICICVGLCPGVEQCGCTITVVNKLLTCISALALSRVNSKLCLSSLSFRSFLLLSSRAMAKSFSLTRTSSSNSANLRCMLASSLRRASRLASVSTT